jgi:hypothetical protein
VPESDVTGVSTSGTALPAQYLVVQLVEHNAGLLRFFARLKDLFVQMRRPMTTNSAQCSRDATIVPRVDAHCTMTIRTPTNPSRGTERVCSPHTLIARSVRKASSAHLFESISVCKLGHSNTRLIPSMLRLACVCDISPYEPCYMTDSTQTWQASRLTSFLPHAADFLPLRILPNASSNIDDVKAEAATCGDGDSPP